MDESLMSLTPLFAATQSNGVTPVTLLSGASGVSRLVELATVYNGYFAAAQTITLYLENDGTIYTLYNNAVFAFSDIRYMPLGNTNGPLVIEDGWDLKAVTTAAATTNIFFTVNYAEDTSDSGGSSPYHIAGLEGGDEQWDTLLSGTSGKNRVVRVLTFSNNDTTTAHHYQFAMYNGATRYVFFSLNGVAAGSAGFILGPNHSVVVPNGWDLQVYCFVAQNTAPSHYTAHYLECNETDYGRT